ncbi:MAG TPA: glycosyl transferase, partial [bacterium]|nr:glycosyl transferase [bacterium]
RSRADGAFGKGLVFAAAVGGDGEPDGTTDRLAFLGAGGSPARPAGLTAGGDLDGRGGAGFDPCIAQRLRVTIAPGEEREVTFLLGEAEDDDDAHACIARHGSPAAVARSLEEIAAFWSRGCSAIRVRTPAPELDLLVNGWLPYQVLSCRIWGRSAFYQSGGAFGYRDQLQDSGSLLWAWPERFRAQILLHAAHQFVEGDVLHWWHPPDSRGIRTRFVDDLLWLPHLTAHYVDATGDEAILGESAPFLTARALAPGEAEAFVRPEPSGDSADLYEHCCRALDRSLRTGAHGLPLFGAGDWNDGMNRVGAEGRGESVWLAMFLYQVLGDFIPRCEARGDRERAARYRAHRDDLRTAVNDAGWDGEWYRRGYYDNGEPLGSRDSDECRIDALVQAWSVLSGIAPADRAVSALDALEKHLVSDEDGLIRLLTPAFDKTPNDPGYIRGYVPGVRENGGQYTHAALWVIRAMAEAGRRDRVAALLQLINPVRHSADRARADGYRVEPYVIAADVYGEPPHVGRGGWTWYTGAAGWMHRVALESLLGIRLREGKFLEIRPCVPDDWPEYTVSCRAPDGVTTYEIRVTNPHGCSARVTEARLDGSAVPVRDGRASVPLARDGDLHHVEVELGPEEPA